MSSDDDGHSRITDQIVQSQAIAYTMPLTTESESKDEEDIDTSTNKLKELQRLLEEKDISIESLKQQLLQTQQAPNNNNANEEEYQDPKELSQPMLSNKYSEMSVRSEPPTTFNPHKTYVHDNESDIKSKYETQYIHHEQSYMKTTGPDLYNNEETIDIEQFQINLQKYKSQAYALKLENSNLKQNEEQFKEEIKEYKTKQKELESIINNLKQEMSDLTENIAELSHSKLKLIESTSNEIDSLRNIIKTNVERHLDGFI